MTRSMLHSHSPASKILLSLPMATTRWRTRRTTGQPKGGGRLTPMQPFKQQLLPGAMTLFTKLRTR